jgi:DNA-directed RNA polymerase subunit RPC12/RpoP
MTLGTAIPIQTIASPRCQKCGAQMVLVCVSLDQESNDKRVYECSHCQHEITEVVKLRKVG